MKRALTLVLVILGVAGVLWGAKAWTQRYVNDKVAKFNGDCDSLIMGIQ
jgi:hypothetical protein